MVLGVLGPLGGVARFLISMITHKEQFMKMLLRSVEANGTSIKAIKRGKITSAAAKAYQEVAMSSVLFGPWAFQEILGMDRRRCHNLMSFRQKSPA